MSVSLSLGTTSWTLNSVCLNQAEQKRIVPSVVKTILPDFKEHWLWRVRPLRCRAGWKWSPSPSYQPLQSLGAGAAYSPCLSSQLTSLWIWGSSQPPAFPLAQTYPGPNFCLKWMCYSSHSLLQRCNGIRGTGLPVGPPKPPPALRAFAAQVSRGDNGILGFSAGIPRPLRDLN